MVNGRPVGPDDTAITLGLAEGGTIDAYIVFERLDFTPLVLEPTRTYTAI